jgi:phosphoribosylaminoimidazole-succinocarboxamide synthase
MIRRKKIYEGKAKILYEGPEPGTVVQYFKDDATAFNAEKKAVIAGKGVLNNRISAHLMTRLESIGIPTHFIRSINMREQLVRKVDIIPIEVVVRNIAAGSLCKRLGIKEGTVLGRPLIEFYYKKDELGDPLVSEEHILTFGWADIYELEEMVAMSWRINDFLTGLFSGIGLRLVDFKIEFGRLWGEEGELYLILADELSPDNCRLWDKKTGEKLDKDRFRFDLGDLVEGYQSIAEKLGLLPEGGIIKGGSINEQMAEKLEMIENELSRERRLRDLKPTKPRKV